VRLRVLIGTGVIAILTASIAPAAAGASAGPEAGAAAVSTTPVPGQAAGSVQTTPPGWLVSNGDALPPCAYGDTITPLARASDWTLTLVDTTFALPAGYAPTDLVTADAAGLSRFESVRSIMIPDLRRMAAAAHAAHASIAIDSGYRSYHTQVYTFRHSANLVGYQKTLLSSARPGHSEHQLGLAIDFRAHNGAHPWEYADWAKQTAAGQWLAANAWRYGFVMSYPKGKTRVTCYQYEPWHYRYVGVAEAAAIHASGLVPRQWLWLHQPNPEPASPVLATH